MTDLTTICAIRDDAVLRALRILGPAYGSSSAVRMLLAIGLQESLLLYRRQVGGPARGLWQFESGGGVKGVLSYAKSADAARALCAVRGVEPTQDSVYQALQDDDILAAGFARLLLWTDPKPLPMNSADGWACYQRTWRPGKPHPEKWDDNWALAGQAAGV